MTVDGGRRAEDQLVHPGGGHGLAEHQGAADVVVEIAQGVLHALADRLESGEMQDPGDRQLLKQPIQEGAIPDVPAHEDRRPPGERGKALHGLHPAVDQVVQYHHFVARTEQLQRRMGTYVACAARDHQHATVLTKPVAINSK